MGLVSKEKKKIGWALNRETIEVLDEIASSLGRKGIKSTCVEAAVLMFSEASIEQRLDYIQRIERAEMTGELDQMFKGRQPRR